MKGSSFEREICHTLSLWWSGGERDDMFWRTAGSGARATGRRKQGKTTKGQYGDICSTDPESEVFTRLITLELKRGYNSQTIADMLDRPKRAKAKKFEQWLLKAKESAKHAGTFWALIHKRDRNETIIYLQASLVVLLRNVRKVLVSFPAPSMTINVENVGRVYAMRLVDFLETVDPFDIMRIARDA